MAIINIQHADTNWFKGPGWYIIDPYNEFYGPIQSKEGALDLEKTQRKCFDPWGHYCADNVQKP